jgi:hypothetical protein
VHPLHEDVLAYIADPASASFEALALAVFAHQFENCRPYRDFCRGRGGTPETVSEWHRIPAVPVEAFKTVELACATPERVFLSTGTTRGAERRSRHAMPDLRLYRASALAGMRRFVFPDCDRTRIVSLIPPAGERPDSSLSQMVAWAMETLADEPSAYATNGADPDPANFRRMLEESERSGQPCCVMTTTAALIRVIDQARSEGIAFRLPHGSRIMDTGGDKGAARRLSRNGLLHACWSTFAVPGYFVVNEYGMAELSSQFYDNVIAERFAGRHRARCKVGPHWARTLVLDPASLEPVAEGESGLLCHFDLANAGTAVAVLTEDVGRAAGEGFEIVGRASGAEARGCSLSVEEWQAAQSVAPA